MRAPSALALTASITRHLDDGINERSTSLQHDMELRNLAAARGDWTSVEAFEFRMRETYTELMVRVFTRGLVRLLPHMVAMCCLYAWIPYTTLPVVGRFPTITAYIAIGVSVMFVTQIRVWRRTRSADTTAPSPAKEPRHVQQPC